MQALGRLVTSGALPAMGVAALAAVFSLLLPPLTSPLSYVGGAVVALVTLRYGSNRGAMVLAGGAAGAGLLGRLALGSSIPVAASTLILWLPVWALAGVLRRSVSLAQALQAAGLIGVAFVVVAYAVTGDPASWWKQILQPMVQSLVDQKAVDMDAATLADLLDRAAGLMTGAMAAVFVVGVIITLLLARAWQAMLFNPGGFRKEFHALRLSPGFGWVTLVVLLGGIALPGVAGAVAQQSGLALLAVYVFAGFALAHGIAGSLGAGVQWLIPVYLLLMVMPVQTGFLLALSGLMDTWMNWRQRVQKQ